MWITDLGSLSGTAIITAAGERRPLVAGVPTAASVGWIVELGRRRITIEPDASDTTSAASADAWLRVHVTDPVHPAHLVARVREALPHALVVLHEPEGRVEGVRSRVVDATTDPLEVAADFVEYATGAAPTEAEALVMRQAYEQALAADRSA